MRWAVALLLVSLAGCAGEPTEEGDLQFSDGSTVDLDSQAKAGDDLGAIAGVVVDETISPIAGANVSINGLGDFITKADGTFGVSDVAPGLYTLMVGADGFNRTQTVVDVVAGDVTKVKVVLPLDLSPVPYGNTLKFDWFDSAGQPLVDFAWDLFRPDGAPPMCDQCEWTFESDAAVQSFIIEGVWTDTVEDPTGATRFYVTMEPTEDTSDYESEYCTSPCYIRYDGNRWNAMTEYFIMMAYEEAWIAVDQKAEWFITMWYVDEAPADYTVLDA